MNLRPSSGLDTFQQQVLTDTARNVMRQLTLNLHALEGKRLMQFQSTTVAVSQRQQPSLPKENLSRKMSGLNQQADYVVDIYQHAAEVIRQSLELEGVFFQHVSTGDCTPRFAKFAPYGFTRRRKQSPNLLLTIFHASKAKCLQFPKMMALLTKCCVSHRTQRRMHAKLS